MIPQARTPVSGQGFDPLAVDLPFISERFRQSWRDFSEYRRRKKADLTDLAVTRILAKLKRWGEDKAIEAIDNSIEWDWKGVFEPKSNGKQAERKCRVPTEEELANWNPYGGNGHDH